jgi:lactate dehydrogenase-like 2-hydroxyacid dehydrogenase
MIRQKQLMKMKQDAVIINVALEGIINELDL